MPLRKPLKFKCLFPMSTYNSSENKILLRNSFYNSIAALDMCIISGKINSWLQNKCVIDVTLWGFDTSLYWALHKRKFCFLLRNQYMQFIYLYTFFFFLHQTMFIDFISKVIQNFKPLQPLVILQCSIQLTLFITSRLHPLVARCSGVTM